MYHIEEVAREDIEERNKIKEALSIANAMWTEEQIRKEALEAWKEKTRLEAMTWISELERTPIVGNKWKRDEIDLEAA